MKNEILTDGWNVRQTPWRALLAAWVIPVSLWASPPKIVVQPSSLDLAPGNAAGFLVQAEGTPPLEYRWSHEGNVLTAATSDLYYIPVSSTSDAGNYRVTVSNGEGSVTSDVAKLDLSPYDDPVDRSFYVTSPKFTGTAVSAVAPDGTILAVGMDGTNHGLYRLDARGAVMSGFNAAPEVASAAGIVSLRPLASGKTLVVIKTGSGEIKTLRIESSGALDSAYVFTPLVASAQFIGWQRDAPLFFSGNQLVRFTPSGAIDPLFHATPEEGVVYKEVDSAGRIYGTRGSTVFRLNADGSPDSSFSPIVTGGELRAVTTLLDGQVLLATAIVIPRSGPGVGPSVIAYTIRFTRFTANGGGEKILPVEFTTTSIEPFHLKLTPLNEGRVLMIGSFTLLGKYQRNGVAILDKDGAVDPHFALLSSAPDKTAIILLSDGRHALINGAFSSLNNHATYGIGKIRMDTTRAPLPPVVLRANSETDTLPAGSDWAFKIYAVGQGPFSIQDRVGPVGLSVPDAMVEDVQSSNDDNHHLIIQGAGGIADPLDLRLKVAPAPPHITVQPTSIVTTEGAHVQFDVKVRGSAPIEYHWLRDGVALSDNFSGDTLLIPKVAEVDLGHYSVVVENALGQVQSDKVTLSYGPYARLSNISVRAEAGTGNKTLILGYIVAGTGDMRVLETAIGPELGQYGIAHPMPDPALEVHTAFGVSTYENNILTAPFTREILEWYGIAGTNPIDHSSKSVQTFAQVGRGIYTMVVDAKDREGGVVLAELFDADNSSCRIINLSVRGWVGTGESIAIPGFVVHGNTPLKVLIRGIGPGLAQFGVGEVLMDPQIRVIDRAGAEVAANDDWQEQPDSLIMPEAMAKVGAFPLAEKSKDAALILTLNPGSYTVLVTGKDGAVGSALMELYEVR